MDNEEQQLRDIDKLIGDVPEINAAGEVVEAAEIDIEGFLASTLVMGFGVVAARAGEHWAMGEDEAKQLGAAITPVINKYFPDAGKSLGVEVTAVIALGMCFVPRYMETARLAAAAEPVAAVGVGGDEFGMDGER